MIKNTDQNYGPIAKLFHWVMGITIICLLIIGFLLENLNYSFLYTAHKALGFLILILVIPRLLWRTNNPVPKYSKDVSKIMLPAANIIHYTFYILMVAIPLSAFIASNAAQHSVSFLFLFDLPSFFDHKDQELAKTLMNIHKLLVWILLPLLGIHICAALYHHFVKKDNIMLRMLPSFFTKNRIKD